MENLKELQEALIELTLENIQLRKEAKKNIDSRSFWYEEYTKLNDSVAAKQITEAVGVKNEIEAA